MSVSAGLVWRSSWRMVVCHSGAQCVGVGCWEPAEFSWLESQGKVKNVMRGGRNPMHDVLVLFDSGNIV